MLTYKNSARNYKKTTTNNQQQQEIDVPLLLLLILVNIPSNVIVSWVLALNTMKRFQVTIRQMQEHLAISYLVTRKKMMEWFWCQVWKGKGNPVGFTLSKAALPSAYDAIISVGQMWIIQTTASFLHTHPEDASRKDRFQLESPIWQGRF